MGEAYKLECGHCGYHTNVFVGIGFMYVDLHSIASFVQDTALKQRIAEFEKEPSTRYEAYNALYRCRACRSLRNELYLEMKSDSDYFVTTYSCGKCMEAMHPVPGDPGAVQLDCPECASGKLTATFYMDWD
ncbi:hypothetical protein SAMN04487970_100277 [Paenibacillus tianmuensis]|uniref:Uncharacterized protein n=1 Tax=Paenibacillus tianmuensis TaxID=624147 RepID=A0A1G4PDX4_9BACL|nr:hypothetical protein [Paenibacillus tianmuensis]SCW30513.1 hypothetical protein SAMN04487970_100277 [Paenibacillus tianmuensis]